MRKCKSHISEHFKKFLKALQKSDKISSHSDVSFQIYYDLFRIRQAQWEYKIGVNRGIDYSLSDIFQDIIARYLRINLPKKYKVFLEYKQGKLRPDILIKKEDKPWAIIEIKTTIGWKRGLVKNKEYLKRLEKLSKEFKIPLKRVFYIFESFRNVNKEFAALFKKKKKPEITKYILPLFEQSPAPYYIARKEKFSGYKKYTDKDIFRLYSANKITHFNDVIKKIII